MSILSIVGRYSFGTTLGYVYETDRAIGLSILVSMALSLTECLTFEGMSLR